MYRLHISHPPGIRCPRCIGMSYRGSSTWQPFDIISFALQVAAPSLLPLRQHQPDNTSHQPRSAKAANTTSTSTSAPRTMDESRLTLLPAEIRNMIWELVVQQPQPIAITTSHREISIQDDSRTRTPGIASVLELCRQTRDECTEMLYVTNSFQFDIYPVESRLADSDDPDYTKIPRNFLHIIGDRSKAALRQIHVKVHLSSAFSRESNWLELRKHDYFTAFSDLGKDLKLESFKCTMISSASPESSAHVDVDLLDLARSHANAIQTLHPQVHIGYGRLVTWDTWVRHVGMSMILKELNRTAGELRVLVASTSRQRVDAIRT